MVSSDDEVEVKPQSVSNYFFEGEGEEKISFSVLPIQWNENERTAGERELLYLRGSADAGLLKVHIPVIAWKFDLTNPTPEMFVLSKDKTWIKLQKPRKSFEEIIRTILITVHCLSYARRDPEATGRSIWDSLSRVFCSYEVRPSRNDLVDHMDLIREALKHDIVLANSKFLVAFLEGKLTKRELSDEVVQGATMSRFIVDDMEDDLVDDVDEDDSNEEEELFDSVCSFCDNGGELLCCEGRCMRSFHANVVAGEESQCVSLGFTEDEVEAMQNFFCKNCEHKQHQCFACGKLGSSNKETGAEVFPCASATCGHFYHPHCVSELLYRNSEVAADQLQKTISAGESFICPLHKCFKCKQGENRADKDLQFAVCRRCPRSYHRRCLPREIAFEENAKEGIVSRAWEGLLPNDRILIYCLNHKIDDELGTPIRDHIIFPGDEQKKTVIGRLGKRKALAAPTEESSLTSKVSSQGKFDVRALKRMSSSAGHGETTKKCERLLTRPDLSRKTKATDISRKSLMEKLKSDTGQVVKSSSADTKKSTLGDMLYERFVVPGTEQKKLGKLADTANDENKTIIAKPKKMLIDELPSLDLDSEKRLLSLMKKAASSVTTEDALKKHKIPSTHANSAKYVVDKTITLGKVEGSVEAVRTALKKLEVDGSSIEDAKAVCEPQVLNQIFKWKNKLKVYLAPFLHGMRYTSFGRHFTKVDKLQEIVDKLHYYVNDGDMIVDFCCGANDFSCLMKKKLDETGKKCFYKNYDILQAKNDFCFEKRDWMTVQKRELAPGSRLIMGLNPPFGVKAALANKFINKALQFGPKLLILIVPPETERLDRKKPPYELVWEDNQFLSGKSFYLPGSVDEHDKQMDQWNLTAPPLYLWSRCDMAAEHKALAEKHGHVFVKIKETQVERDSSKTYAADHSREEDQGDTSVLDDFPLQSNEMKELQEAGVDDINGSSEGATEGEDLSNLTHGGKTTRKRKHGKKKVRRVISEISPLGAQNGGRHLASETCNRFPQHSTATVLNVKSSLEGHSSKSLETPSRVESYQCNKMPHSPAAKPIDTDEMSHISTGTAINAGYSLQDLPLKSIEMPSYTRFDDNVHQHFDDKEVPQCSPNNLTAKCPLENRFSRSVELPSETGFGSAYHHVEPTISSSHMQMGTTYNGTPACMPDDMGSYGVSNSEPARGVNYGFLHGGNSDERFAGHVRNDSFGHRVFMSRDMGSDMRPHTRMYGQDFPEPPSRYGQMGSMSYDVHGNLGPSAEASYRMSTSTMERYAPRLDQMHNQRMSPFRPEPFMQNRTGFYEPRAPQPGFPPEVDFAPGFPHPFPHQGSGGWVDG